MSKRVHKRTTHQHGISNLTKPLCDKYQTTSPHSDSGTSFTSEDKLDKQKN